MSSSVKFASDVNMKNRGFRTDTNYDCLVLRPEVFKFFFDKACAPRWVPDYAIESSIIDYLRKLGLPIECIHPVDELVIVFNLTTKVEEIGGYQGIPTFDVIAQIWKHPLMVHR